MFDCDVVVVVPGLPLAVPDLYEADSPLDETAGDEDLPGLGAVAIGFEHMLGFAVDVESLGRFLLHAVGELEGVNAGIQGWVAAALLGVFFVEGGEHVELPTLSG